MICSPHLHGVVELAFEAARPYDNPLWEPDIRVEFDAPSGRRRKADGFWDGGLTWRVRFSPDEAGPWTWHSVCGNAADAGLHGREGSFVCVAATPDLPLYRRGPLRVAPSGSHLQHADGTPFFWLADTAWNGVIRGDDDNWRRYLTARREQGFTAVQFVLPHWRGDVRDEEGETACTEVSPIQVNPAYFQRKDRRVAMVNEAGLLAAPVVLWSLLEDDLGSKLPEADATRLARYIVARYGAHQVLWMLGGDGNYPKMGPARWKRLGRAVYGEERDRLVTLHPCGLSWVGEEFRTEPWYDLIGYQSGHGDAPADVRWLVEGPPATQWAGLPPKPVINLEPNYEGAYGYQAKTCFSDRHVRTAAYRSCLVSPTAGVTYGHDRIWTWNLVAGPCEGHGNWGHGHVEPWHTAVKTPGAASMGILRRFFESIPWWDLRPAPAMLSRQPGAADPTRFVAAARSVDGRLGVIHLPQGGEAPLARLALRPAWWFNPARGERVGADPAACAAPDDGDWLLVLESPAAG